MQVQNDKALTVNGDVYVNSDVDANTWNNLPDISAARDPGQRQRHPQERATTPSLAGGHAAVRLVCDQNGTSNKKTFPDRRRNPTGRRNRRRRIAEEPRDPAIASPTLGAPGDGGAGLRRAADLLRALKSVTFTRGPTRTELRSRTDERHQPQRCRPPVLVPAGYYYFNFPTNSNTWTVNDGGARSWAVPQCGAERCHPGWSGDAWARKRPPTRARRNPTPNPRVPEHHRRSGHR